MSLGLGQMSRTTDLHLSTFWGRTKGFQDRLPYQGLEGPMLQSQGLGCICCRPEARVLLLEELDHCVRWRIVPTAGLLST